ncbi:MAG TPA: hypothetical protein VJO52_16410 [Gemmatimonadaceae bacterium]|nr:hypothetical protein [Gemmatimonadaceae bacterium]
MPNPAGAAAASHGVPNHERRIRTGHGGHDQDNGEEGAQMHGGNA